MALVSAPNIEDAPLEHAPARFLDSVCGSAPIPDVLVTGDGEHLAIVGADGVPVLLRARSVEFVRGIMGEASAYDGDPLALEGRRSRSAPAMPASPTSFATAAPGACSRSAAATGSNGSSSPRRAATPTSSSPAAACRKAAPRAGSSSTAPHWGRAVASRSTSRNFHGSKAAARGSASTRGVSWRARRRSTLPARCRRDR